MVTICIICVYFGNLPNYFDLYLKSCEYNTTIDFLFVTDQQIEYIPENFTVLNYSFEEFRNLVIRKMGFGIALNTPYKLCDYKPVYGQILEDYLEGYDYWGHSDCDLIWGDIRYFVDTYCIEKYDKFLPMGHLSFYRNTKECNRYYMLSGSEAGDFKYVYSINDSCLFDEAIGVNQIYKQHNIPFFDKPLYADIDVRFRRFRLQEFDSVLQHKLSHYNDYCFPKGSNYNNQIFYWESGKCFRAFLENNQIKHQEFMYIHLQKRRFSKHNISSTDCCFLITSSGFYKMGSEITFTDFGMNKYQGKVFENMEYCGWLIKRVCNHLKKKVHTK